jgi:hypothetical protein
MDSRQTSDDGVTGDGPGRERDPDRNAPTALRSPQLSQRTTTPRT